MSKNRSVIVGLCVCLSCSSVQAQDFRNWAQFANWCRSTGGDPVPNPPRCFPRQSGPTQNAPSQEAADFEKDIDAYSSLVNRMRRGVPNPTGFWRKYGAMPESSDGLSERLLQLNEFEQDLRQDEADALDDAEHERDHAAKIPSEITAIKNEIGAIQNQNKGMTGYVRSADSAVTFLGAYACHQQTHALRWFKYVTPKDSLSEAVIYYGDSAGVGTGLSRPTRIPELKAYIEPPPSALFPRSHVILPRLDISGYSTKSKISVLNNVYEGVLSLDAKIGAVHNEYDRTWLKDREGELYQLQRLRDRAVFNGRQLAEQVKVAHQNFVVAAVEAFVWKTYVTHIPIEEAKKFYDLNKSWYQIAKASQIADDDVKRYVEAGKSALNILGSQARGMKEFLDVQKQTLDLITNTQRFLLQAPRIAALATPEQTQSFLETTVDKEQNEYYEGVIKTMQGFSSDLAPSVRFTQALRGVKLPGPYRNIAKKLGLVE